MAESATRLRGMTGCHHVTTVLTTEPAYRGQSWRLAANGSEQGSELVHLAVCRLLTARSSAPSPKVTWRSHRHFSAGTRPTAKTIGSTQ